MNIHSFRGFSKNDILDAIHRLPADATLDDARYSLYVLKKLEEGLLDLSAGRTDSNEEVQEYLQRRVEGDSAGPQDSTVDE